MSTPLASIFASGFLVVVPILASAVGPYSILAMMVVAFVAFLVGKIVRHNILVLNLFWLKEIKNLPYLLNGFLTLHWLRPM